MVLFPKHFTNNGSLKLHTLRSTRRTWSPHDGKTQSFSGFFTIYVQHKTSPEIIPIIFYIFKDSTRPFTLLSYPASIHLEIFEFKVLNEASSHAVMDLITNNTEAKQVTFSTPLHTSTPSKKTPPKKPKLKSIFKQTQLQLGPFQAYKVQQLAPFQDHSPFSPFDTKDSPITRPIFCKRCVRHSFP